MLTAGCCDRWKEPALLDPEGLSSGARSDEADGLGDGLGGIQNRASGSCGAVPSATTSPTGVPLGSWDDVPEDL